MWLLYRRLVVSAHYDSKINPEGFIGAIDSAAPCAMLLSKIYTLIVSIHVNNEILCLILKAEFQSSKKSSEDMATWRV